MHDMQPIATFLGWCTIINAAILLLSAMLLTLARTAIAGIHARLVGIDRQQAIAGYFSWLGNYKLAIIMFNFVPWIALKLMA